MNFSTSQLAVFFGLTALIALTTYWFCRGKREVTDSSKDYFLAGGELKWYFVAGSITLTNLSTDQLIGMNGDQMALLAWWELSAVIGLIMLCFLFIPVYYKYKCTTTTELLERRYNDPHIRALISILFLAGNVFIFLPAILYGGSLFMIQMFDLEGFNPAGIGDWANENNIKDYMVYPVAIIIAFIGAAYAIFGGLRAIAISDTFSGILLLTLALTVVGLALKEIGWDFSGIPESRTTLIGEKGSPIPFGTLFTGMIFIQMFYWSTNQTITQRAMASPSVKEAQKGILAAAAIRLLIVPPIIVLPGIISFKLYGEIPDNKAYGMIVADLLPDALNGAFAAAILAAVLTSFNSILNASAALWVCDIHKTYISKEPNIRKLSFVVSAVMVLLAFIMVPIFIQAESLIGLVQKLYGLLSMPILSAFIVGLLFKNVNAKAVFAGVLIGVTLYAFFTFVWPVFPSNDGVFIHYMAITLITSVISAMIINHFIFKQKAVWDAHNVFGKAPAEI